MWRKKKDLKMFTQGIDGMINHRFCSHQLLLFLGGGGVGKKGEWGVGGSGRLWGVWGYGRGERSS